MKLFYLIFNLCHQGGMERILTCKVNYLCDVLGYDVTVVTAHQRNRPDFFPLSPKVKRVDLGVNIHLPFLIPIYMRRLSALAGREKPDIIISMCYGEMPYVPSMTDGSVKLAEFHFSYASFAIRGKIRQRRRFERSIGKFDKFIVLTDEDKQQWSRFADNVVRIYNPLTFFGSQNTEELSPLDTKRCIAAGRLVKEKNYPDMLKAWSIVHSFHPDWKLDIYGEGKERSGLLTLCKKLGIDGCVTINPPTVNLRKEFLSSSIFLLSSVYEGFALVILEAASVGLPAVSYSCPCGPSGLIQDKKSGYLVEPGNVEAFAQCICRLIDEEELRKKFGGNAYEFSKSFSIDSIMNQWGRLFSASLSQTGKGNF